jgi:MFS family permease
MFGSRNYSRNYGVVFTAYGIGAIAGVLASGLLLDVSGSIANVFLFVAFLCILGFTITLLLFGTHKLKAPDTDIILE